MSYILHAPGIRSKDIPFIVFTTKGVFTTKRERLRRNGAIILAVETITKSSWIEGGPSKWEEVFDKLRLWDLTQFDRICFLNGDTVLNRPPDGVFLDTAAATHNTLDHSDKLRSDEASLPCLYVFADQSEMNREHRYSPSETTHDYPNVQYLNAGFFVMKPSLKLLNHYLSIMTVPHRFVPEFPEQNLFNYAHRSEADGGNMPWQLLDSQWNLYYPTLLDLEGGVASLHEKWWVPED